MMSRKIITRRRGSAITKFFAWIWLIIAVEFNNYFVRAAGVMETSSSYDAILLRELSGSHLLMSASPDPPWFNEKIEANGSSTYYGLHVNICDYIAEALNVTYSFVRIRKDEEIKIGRREATFNLLKRGEVDIGTKFAVLTLNECRIRTDCSIPLFVTQGKLMVPWPQEDSRIMALIRPFQVEVWLLLAISVILVTLTMTHIPSQVGKDKGADRSQKWTTVVLFVFTGKGEWNHWKCQLAFRIVQATWCLAALLFLNAYSSTVTSYFTAPKLMQAAKNLDEVAHGYPQNVKLLVEKDGFMAEQYLRASSGTFKMLGDSMRRYPDSTYIGQAVGLGKMFSGKYAYFASESQVMVFMDLLYKMAGNHCRFTVSKSNDASVFAFQTVWTFQKHWRYTDVVNHRLKWLAEFGLVSYWSNKILPKLDQCQLDNYKKASGRRRVYSLHDLMGPFIFLLAGIAISCMVFLVELVFKFNTRVVK